MISEQQANSKPFSSHNDVTGDNLVSKTGNQKAFEEGWERIFKKKRELEQEEINKSYAVDVESKFKPFLAEEVPLNVLGEGE